eukprot:TRINITY_DN4557_c0_g1_i1.p1 TRINITY_DN4557_c0_g1~~TRINITY_DN4557_c0_g1_i1.p1  ORF type:complete len:137 (-),score=39.00 TRINITY_DN4557_c0_g1_i1:10-363(-)
MGASFAEVTNLNNEWNVEINVEINSQNIWQFIIQLDKLWAFDAFHSSTLSLAVNSPSIATGPIPTTFDDLLHTHTICMTYNNTFFGFVITSCNIINNTIFCISYIIYYISFTIYYIS